MAKKQDEKIVADQIEADDQNDGLDNEDLDIAEAATAAAASLKPMSTKYDKMQKVVDAMGKMNVDDLSYLLDKSLDLIGNEADKVPAGAAAKNAASIKAKSTPVINIKEDIAALFGNDETLSEQFIENATALVEATIDTAVQMKIVEIEEHYEEQFEDALNEEMETLKGQLLESLDDFLDYTVTKWLEENKLQVEVGLRTQIAESFIRDLNKLCAESYISLPDDQIDLVEELTIETESLTDQLNAALNENIDLTNTINEAKKQAVIYNVSESLTGPQRDKFNSLIEHVDFENIEKFEERAKFIAESVIGVGKSTRVTKTQNLIVEQSEQFEQEDKPVVSASMNSFVNSLSRLSK